MTRFPFFEKAEYDARLRAVRESMLDLDLDACLISVPENIYYLAGVNHWGFFAYHMLIVTPRDEMILIARAMERVTMDLQLVNTRFVGFEDLDDPSRITLDVLKERGLDRGRLGVEKNSLYLAAGFAERIRDGLPGAGWADASDLVHRHRVTLSPSEIEYTREAAAITDAMMKAAIDTAAAGVTEKEVAAEVHRAMILAGGEYPAFGPFIRSTPTLGLEHGTWTDRRLEAGDALFVELSGSAARYHAPMGRFLFVGETPPGTEEIAEVCLDAFENVTRTIRPGVTADEVYQSWQDRVDQAGLSHYRRHHCGYMVGSAFPPAWSGGGVPRGLRCRSDMELQAGMVFHLMSWLMHTGRDGDYFVSDSALVTENGCEVLTTMPQRVHVV
ncbi:MAG: Xaa-Pro peptidase family protein [Deltaproteobacteria bacterium]|nr:Xaa-Pro peptidase family protein [Deltaproteobacteria bacterium]